LSSRILVIDLWLDSFISEGIIKDPILQSGPGDKMVEYVNTGILLIVFGYLIKLSGRISRIEGYLDLKINKKL